MCLFQLKMSQPGRPGMQPTHAMAAAGWGAVFAVRHAAVDNLRQLAEAFGPAWAEAFLYPKVLAFAQQGNFLNRLTTLFAINTLAASAAPAVLAAQFLPVIAGMQADPVANIR